MKQQEYDVIVIGSGVGGLSAGALLANKGYKTMVVESMGRLGGKCSTEEHEGFKLATGAIGIHRNGIIDEIYEEVGAKLDLVDVPRLWFRVDGKDYEMPPKGAVKAFLEIVSKLEVQRGRLIGHIAKEVAVEKFMGFFRRGVRGEEKKEDITFRDWLLRYTDNELAHKTFDAFSCTLMGLHINEVPAFQMFNLFSKVGGWRAMGIAPRGNIVNADSLAQVIKANNGEVWANCPAKQIIVRNRISEGVVVQKDGKEFEITSKVVISNINPKNTVGLAGKENFNERYMAQLQEMVPFPAILAQVASDQPLCLEDGEPGSLVIAGARRIYGAFPLTNVSPDLAPPGQHLMYCFGSPPSSLHLANIEKEIEQSVLDIKEQFPKFERHGRILKIEVINMNWPRPVSYIPQDTPIENLYNVGDAVTPPGEMFGTPGAAESAKCVTAKVKSSVKPHGK